MDVTDNYVDLGSDGSIDESGFVTDYNLPGDTAGETNGLYAGVTENMYDAGAYDYIHSNPGGKTDILSSFANLVNSGSKAVTEYQRGQASVAATKAASAVKPTLLQQWAALQPFEKFGVLASIFGIVWALKK